MRGASQIPLLLGLLGCLVTNTHSRNSTTAITNKRFCSQIMDVPEQVLHMVSSLKKGSVPIRTQTAIFTTFRERERPLRRLGYRKEEPMVCNGTNNHVQGKIREYGKRILVELRACQAVRNIVIQLRSLGFIQKRHNRRLITCERMHDTMVLSQPSHRETVSIAPVTSRKSGELVSIAWNYELEDDVGSTSWFYSNNNVTTGLHDVDLNAKTTMEYPDVQANECRFSSIRFGTPQCKHMECDYLLTYTFVNHTMLVMELSGKSDGWIALILSSDQQVGGDEMIACKRKSLGSDLEAMSGWINLPHSRPERKSAKTLLLVKQEDKNGYIYCKMVRTINLNDVGGDTSLDLTAKWYQMYATGKIDGSGAMLQHSKTPPTTTKQISMLVPYNISIRSFQSKNVDVSQQKKERHCTGDAFGDRLAAQRLGSPLLLMTFLLSLFWKLRI